MLPKAKSTLLTFGTLRFEILTFNLPFIENCAPRSKNFEVNKF